MFVACFCGLLAYAVTREPRYPVVTEHHVKVLGQLPDGDWAMSSDEQGSFAYRPCKDFDADSILHQAVGFIADRAKWEERGACKSIRRADLGFWWRDNNYEYRRILQ